MKLFHNPRVRKLGLPMCIFFIAQIFVIVFLVTGIDTRTPTADSTKSQCIVVEEIERVHTPFGGGRYAGSTKVYIWSEGVRYKWAHWHRGVVDIASGIQLEVTYYIEDNEIIAASGEEIFYTVDDYLVNKKIGAVGTVITCLILEILLCVAFAFWYFLFARRDTKQIFRKCRKAARRG